MLEDGNCLFRAVADQVYGDSEAHDLVRQMCIDYMVTYFYLLNVFSHVPEFCDSVIQPYRHYVVTV